MGPFCVICEEEVHAPDEPIDLDTQSFPYSIGIEDKAICEGCARDITESYKRHIYFIDYLIKERKRREFRLSFWFKRNLKGWSKSLFMIVFAISCYIGFGFIIELLKKLW